MAATEVTEAEIAEYLALAAATPRRIAATTAGHDETRLMQPPAPGEWSVLEIFNHLRACEEVWMHSVHAMLTFDNPNLQEIHPRQWIKEVSPYTTQSFAGSLQVFTLRRQALLITLESLTMADWRVNAVSNAKRIRYPAMYGAWCCMKIRTATKLMRY